MLHSLYAMAPGPPLCLLNQSGGHYRDHFQNCMFPPLPREVVKVEGTMVVLACLDVQSITLSATHFLGSSVKLWLKSRPAVHLALVL